MLLRVRKNRYTAFANPDAVGKACVDPVMIGTNVFDDIEKTYAITSPTSYAPSSWYNTKHY